MKLDEIHIIQKPLVLATSADVDMLEKSLWITFPNGYREYITQLGEGCLSDLIRIYPPWRIENELIDWRRRINDYWFWELGHDVLPKERALECIVIADTLNGDELVFHPGRPNHIFVLPHEEEKIFDVGPDILSAIQWMCTSGELVEPIEQYNFEPFDSRHKVSNRSKSSQDPIDPEGQSLHDILELGKRWAQRHSAQSLAQELVQQGVKKHCGDDKTANLQHEGILWEGQMPYNVGYTAVYQITDKTSKLEIGKFYFNKTKNSHGYTYVKNEANITKLPGSDKS